MNKNEWDAFQDFRSRFRLQCEHWSKEAENPPAWLSTLQKQAAEKDKTPTYPIENPIVYNKNLDSITKETVIKLILTGDNPGKNEQLSKNQQYLVGLSGKLADGFFKKNPTLNIDFRSNVLILNKSPIHTARTKQLSFLLRHGGQSFKSLFEETQKWMAKETASLQKNLFCPHWIVGYSELTHKGIFSVYASELSDQYISTAEQASTTQIPVYLFQHFSMNRFSIDLAQQSITGYSLKENLTHLGLKHRNDILHW